MEALEITGGMPLKGAVSIGGAKNAALPILAACLLTEEPCILDNIPDLSDIRFMLEILEHLGAQVERLSENKWKIQAKNVTPHAPYELVRKMRASVCLMGPLVGRFKRAEISLPGGCVIGHRPIDIHLRAFQKLGCSVETHSGYVRLDASQFGLIGKEVFLGGRHGSTVTGTANILMAATLAQGTTQIDFAACEPEIVDLCHMLIKMGAQIEGVGSHMLRIHGVASLKGCTHVVIPDRIEAGTLLAAGLFPGNAITLKGANAGHLAVLLHLFENAPIRILPNGDIECRGCEDFLNSGFEVTTLPYPGFPTDLQAQLVALACATKAVNVITERIYPSRFMHVPELERMGARITLEGASVIVQGRGTLTGASVMASDLRASASLVLAGLFARGKTTVNRIYHLDRGYEKLEEKFRGLGAIIERTAQTPELACTL